MSVETKALQALFERDLNKLAEEIRQYPSEKSLWLVKEGIANSGGNLCLHLCGNLQHFIGTVLGKSGYVRNRDAEFSSKDIARKTLLEEIENTKLVLAQALPGLSAEQLEANYPVEVFGHPMTTIFFMIHLYGHLGYHLGQVNYHRRLVAQNS